MSATDRAEWHRRFRAFAETLRGCPVNGECAHCEGLITETIEWLRGTDDRADVAA